MIFSINPTFFEVLPSYLLAAVLTLIVTAAVALADGNFLFAVIVAAVFFIMPISRHIRLKYTVYTLTTTKVEIRTGILSKSAQSIPLHHIDNVEVSETLKERMIGIGDVLIDSAALDSKMVLNNIREPAQVRRYDYVSVAKRELKEGGEKLMDVGLLKQQSENAEHAQADRGSRIEDRGSRIASSHRRRSSIFNPRSSILFRLFVVLFSVLLLTASGAQGQSNDKELLPDRLGENWQAVNQARVLDAERLSSLADADVLREYGLQRVISRVYTDGKIKSSVEVFELKLIPNALRIVHV